MTKKELQKALENWDDATDNLARCFVAKYFGEDYEEDDDWYWVGSDDQDREVIAVGDYFFSIQRIVDSLRYEATEKQLFDYYDMELEENPPDINFQTYIKLKK